MFNNPFLKKDSLLEAVKGAQHDGECRRQAEKIVNEEFGVYSRNAVIRENLAAYDAALEEVYANLKEGKKGDGNLANNYPPYDKVTRGDVIAGATGKDQMGGKKKVDEEEQIDEISRDTLKSYVKKADRQAANLERKVERRKDRPGEEEKMYKRIEGANLARKKMGVRVAATEETQLDELTRPKNYQTVQKVMDRADEHDFDYDSSYTRSNRLYRWTKKNYPSKRDTRNQKPTGKTELGDYSHEKNLKRTGGIKKDGVMKKWSQNQLKKDVKGRLGKHTAPNLPEETQSDSIFGAKMSNKGHPNVYHDDAATSYKATADRMRGGEKPYNAHAADLNKIYEKKMWEGNLDPKDSDVTAASKTISKGPYEDPSTPKVPYSELPKTGNRAGAVIDSAKGALKESIIAKINAKHMKEDSSFNAAQETGKSVNEVAMEAPPTPSWVNKPNPGVHRAASRTGGTQRLQGSTYYRGMSAEPQSTKGTGRLVSPQTARATGPLPKTGTSLVPSGNRLPVASTGGGGKPPSVPGGGASSASGGSNLPTSRASGAVTNTQQPIKTTYTKTTTPGVNPPHPSEKIGGFGNFKPASGSSGLGAAVKGIIGATARGISRIAGGPVGAYLGMTGSAGEGENEFARQAKLKSGNNPYKASGRSVNQYEKDVLTPKASSKAPEAPKTSAPAAKPTVKQSFSQAYKAAREAGGSKAQFKFGDKTYQAAATKKEYVPMSQQKPVDVTPKAAPTPPSRPKDLASTSAPAPSASKNPSWADQEKAIKSTPTPDTVVPKAARVGRETTGAPNISGSVAAPVSAGDSFEKTTPESKPKTKSVNESVQVGTNKYRIL